MSTITLIPRIYAFINSCAGPPTAGDQIAFLASRCCGRSVRAARAAFPSIIGGPGSDFIGRSGDPAFKTDQIGKGMDYTGLHHFGILVEDMEDAAKIVEGLGGRHYMDQDNPERAGGFEAKFYGPEGILFDVAEHPWTGSEALPAAVKEAAE